MSQRKWAVLIRTYTEHKLVVTRLNGFMAVESPENRKKWRFLAEAQRLYIRFCYAYKLYLSCTSLYIDKSPADHARKRHVIAVYVRRILLAGPIRAIWPFSRHAGESMCRLVALLS